MGMMGFQGIVTRHTDSRRGTGLYIPQILSEADGGSPVYREDKACGLRLAEESLDGGSS